MYLTYFLLKIHYSESEASSQLTLLNFKILFLGANNFSLLLFIDFNLGFSNLLIFLVLNSGSNTSLFNLIYNSFNWFLAFTFKNMSGVILEMNSKLMNLSSTDLSISKIS